MLTLPSFNYPAKVNFRVEITKVFFETPIEMHERRPEPTVRIELTEKFN